MRGRVSQSSLTMTMAHSAHSTLMIRAISSSMLSTMNLRHEEPEVSMAQVQQHCTIIMDALATIDMRRRWPEVSMSLCVVK